MSHPPTARPEASTDCRDTGRQSSRRFGHRFVALVAATAALVTGCATGERPFFSEDASEIALPTRTGDPDVDLVLSDLDDAIDGAFTADYEVLTRFGGKQSTVRVVQTADGQASITINRIRFLRLGGSERTCDLDAGTCEDGIVAQRVSDVTIFPDFYARDFGRRLRVDYQRHVGATDGFDITQGNLPARCVSLDVTGGTKTYCTLEAGPLARYDGPDVFIELVGYDLAPDQTAFETP